MAIRWFGLVAPENQATGDRRMFAAQSLRYRDFPLPAAWQRMTSSGHGGSIVVASWDRQYAGDGGIWGAGEFLDPRVVPEVTEAIYLLEKRLIGPSVDLDPDLAYEVVDHPTLPGEFAMQVTRATVHGVTFVQGPAFPQVHITVDDDDEMALLASAGITIAQFAVNSSSWRRLPLAPRETAFEFETATANMAAWSGGDPAKFGQGFLWKDPEGNPANRETYRLPIADVIDGKLYLIPRAVFSAGTIMSGGHGGLYDTLDESERIKVQEVITDIYDMLRDEYGDPRVIAPWQRGGRAGATSSQGEPTRASLEDTVTASGVLAPPKEWFDNPRFAKPTRLQVTEDGRVFGHLATWKRCHLGVGNKCVIAPKSKTGYRFFHLGTVVCDDGTDLPIGKITLGTGHADKSYGVIPAAEHYDNTGTCVAVVRAGEDRHGVFVVGALVADTPVATVAELRRSPLSGDWRRVDGNLELVAALAVNDPGFPVTQEDVDGMYSLTAAGVLQDLDAGEVEDGSVHLFVNVDKFLHEAQIADRVRVLSAAFDDLLPSGEEGCGCDVQL